MKPITIATKKSLWLIAAMLIAFSGSLTYAGVNLSFQDRVMYQTRIEQVYWNHTVWPSQTQKPSLQAVLSDAEIRLKVENYLKESEVLATEWNHPITEKDLQMEIDRMANESKDTQVLRELWNALQMDPAVIAECLARPLLVARTTERLEGFESWWDSHNQDVSMLRSSGTIYSYRLPQIHENRTFALTASNVWSATTTTSAPSGREAFTAISTGAKMIVWGGFNGTKSVKTGGQYDPATNTWSATKTTGAPADRESHVAVWTGTRMIIWGGDNSTGRLNSGGAYNPATNSWTTIASTGSPSPRAGTTAVWTGTLMLVWGGYDGAYVNTGGRYNPSTDSWTTIKTTGAPVGRAGHTSVWSGTLMVVWGGRGTSNRLNSGGRYNPSTDSWTKTTLTGAPVARMQHTAIWTGKFMIIWGGENGLALNTGSKYNPSTNKWTATTTNGAPSARDNHAAVWTGTRMIVWGGADTSPQNTKTGGIYDPNANSWITTSLTGTPSARRFHNAVWVGTQMIVWGGFGAPGYPKLGGRFTP